MHGPSPALRHPLPAAPRLGFLKHFITRPTIVVGDYTRWWDWDAERITRNVTAICSGDVKALLDAAP